MEFLQNKAGRLTQEFLDDELAKLPQNKRQGYFEENKGLYDCIYKKLILIEEQMGDVLRDPLIDPKDK